MKKTMLCAALAISSIINVYAQNGRLTWSPTKYNGMPWVQRVSRPNKISEGLEGQHFSIWASHGKYYDIKSAKWKWQRPLLFGTTEDLYTQTIVLPYLIPMLENAGAVVFTPRDRDWQKNEIIVDNDNASNSYREESLKYQWQKTSEAGFAWHAGGYTDGENPFVAGTARQVRSRKRKSKLSSAVYQPDIPQDGKYAVYVSYQTQKKSVDDAEYIVFHKGEETHFRVNQQMGGNTWVYLGTFDFTKGNSINNAVVVTNRSNKKGIITTDAVRFGSGMGNILRGGKVSGVPRFLEGARYYTQWAGAPRRVVSSSNGSNDYNDDINSRSLMINWLAGGSCYLPNKEGKKVPFELSLAVHSDAGVKYDGSYIGSLAICTTQQGNTLLGDGLSREVSKRFAQQLVDNIKRDVNQEFNVSWTTRSVWDRNYSETRVPEIPSVILETLSHQNFPDIRLGQDPNFKFTLARSIYKTILKYQAEMHKERYVVQPLAPNSFSIEFISKRKIRLHWNDTKDIHESTATPNSYNVYASIGKNGFDNGVNIKRNSFDIELQPGILYNFKVTACNKGGESFPTETLSALRKEGAKNTILIVNGFQRLSSPAIINNSTEQGFDLSDPGLSYGFTAGWAGKQTNFQKSLMGKEGINALGYGTEELVGEIIAGNNYNYVTEHAEAIQASGEYNIVSCNRKAVENRNIKLTDYPLVDLVLGNEKNDGYSLVYYKSFTPALRQQISNYLKRNGKLFVSGSYIASDMRTDVERKWLEDNLKISFISSNTDHYQSSISGMGTKFDIYRTANSVHYGAYYPDNIQAIGGNAFNVLNYGDGHSAAVAFKQQNQSVFTMSFPFECIKDKSMRNKIMKAILTYMMNK